MKNGFIEAIINFFKGLHEDTVTFVKGFLVGGVGSFVYFLNAKSGHYDLFFGVIIKVCYIGGYGILSGMAVTIGKKIINRIDKIIVKQKQKKSKESPFSKNGTNNKNVA